MLRKMSIGSALIALIICVKLYGEFNGFENGYNLAFENIEKLMPKDYPKFSGGVGTIYSFFDEIYLLVIVLLSFYIGGKFIESKRISQVICVSALALITFQFWRIYNYFDYLKDSLEINIYTSEPFYSLIQNSISYNWICFFIILTLLIIQIIQYVKYISKRKED